MTATTIDKLRSYAGLNPGWDYGKGSPIQPHLIELAIDAEKLLRARGYPETDCFPGGDGEIQVCGYLNRKCVTIEVSEESY